MRRSKEENNIDEFQLKKRTHQKYYFSIIIFGIVFGGVLILAFFVLEKIINIAFKNWKYGIGIIFLITIVIFLIKKNKDKKNKKKNEDRYRQV